jgi:predicted ferric reductase
MMIGPPAGTFVFERNPAAVWIACGILGITSAVLMMRRRS